MVLVDYVETRPDVALFCRHESTVHTDDGVPLILLHGNRDNHTHYTELQALLAEHYLTVAVDFRGHGLSSTLDVPASMELFAEDVRGVMDHYGWQTAILVGHSFGSGVSMTVARLWPERVAALVLMGSAAVFRLPFKRPETFPTRETFAEFVRDVEGRARPVFFHDQYPEVARKVCAAWSTMTFDAHVNLIAGGHPDMRPVVRELTVPTMVIAGEKDLCTPVEQAEWIHANHRKCELRIIPNTAHFMYMEEPELVGQEITGFAKRVFAAG